MASTLTAGNDGATGRGYSSGAVSGAFGSMSPATFAGVTVWLLETDPTSFPNQVVLLTPNGTASTLNGVNLTINGLTIPFQTTSDVGPYTLTSFDTTGTGFSAFGNGGSYTIDSSAGGPTYAGPAYVGVSTGAGNAASVPISFASSGRSSGDLLFIAVMTANQAVPALSGWTEVATYSPQSRGTAGAAGGVRLTLLSKVSDGTEGTITIGDSGDIQYAAGLVIRGASGASVEIDIGAGNNVAATTSGSFGGVTTTGDDRLICHFVATDRDASAASWGTPTNANLANLTERFDNGTATGTGGGIGIWTGEKQAAGATGNTTSTQAASAAYCWITLALKNGTGGGPATYNETLTESTAAAQSATTTATFPNTRAETVASAASEAVSLAAPTTLSESLVASDAETAALTHQPALAETLTAAESSATAAAFVSTLNESAAAGESSATMAIFASAASESVTGADSAGPGMAFAVTRAETIAANDNAAAASSISASLVEAASAGETASSSHDAQSSVTEAIAAGESAAGSSSIAASLDESIEAGEESTASIEGGAITYNETLSEAVAASESAATVATLAATRSEALTSAASQSAAAIVQAARSEGLTPGESGQSSAAIATSIDEQAAASAAQSIAAIFAYALSEPVAANDDEAASLSIGEELQEDARAADAYEVEGGERVPPSEARNVASALASRTANSNEPARDASTAPSPRNQVTAVGARDAQSVRLAR